MGMMIFFAVIAIIIFTIGFLQIENNRVRKYVMYPLSILFLLLSILSTSILNINKNEIAQFNKRILGSSLTDGKIIATDGEMGPQAWIYREGFYFKFLVHVIYNVEYHPILTVPANKVATLVAKDGLPLDPDEFFAPDWRKSVPQYAKMKLENSDISKSDKSYYEKISKLTPEEIESKMLDANFFLKNGGKKGPQYNILRPAKYPVNSHLWTVAFDKSTVVKPGEVGVVTSRYGKKCKVETSSKTSALTAPLVKKGCIGIWKDTLSTGNYYYNRQAIDVNNFGIRIQTWIYNGGYTPREVEVRVSQDGKIVQKNIALDTIPIPENAADGAISIKTKDKWIVRLNLTIQIQPEPEYVSAIYASVGGLAEIENKSLTPTLQSILRNMGEKYEAKDFIEKRSTIENEVEKLMIFEAKKYGITLKDIRFGTIDVDPAVMIPGKIEQLSKDLKKSYIEQDNTFKQLILTNETKATADQQYKLVQAKIEKERANYTAQAKELLGIGEEKYLKALSRGQKAQKAVLGADKTYQLQITKEIVELCKKDPKPCSTVPLIYSVGGSSSDSTKILESFGALGIKNLVDVGKTMNKDIIIKQK
jgi:hypothetical protein